MPKSLDDIYNAIKGLHDAYIIKHPRLEPYDKVRIFCFYGGSYLGRALTLAPGQDAQIISWEGCPAHLYLTTIGVTMPDATLPDVGEIVVFDHYGDLLNWTVNEYYTVLGLGPNPVGTAPFANYGGCSLWDAVNFYYVSLTPWDYAVSNDFEVRVRNWTNVPVDLTLFDCQVYTTGGSKFIKYSRWGPPALI